VRNSRGRLTDGMSGPRFVIDVPHSVVADFTNQGERNERSIAALPSRDAHLEGPGGYHAVSPGYFHDGFSMGLIWMVVGRFTGGRHGAPLTPRV